MVSLKQGFSFFLGVALIFSFYFYKQTALFKKESLVSICQDVSKILKPLSFPLVENSLSKIGFSHFEDQMYLIHFWRSDCAPCLDEWPELIKFVKKSHIPLVSLTSDSKESVISFFKSLKLPLHENKVYLGLDQSDLIRKMFSVRFLPQTYLIGPRGKLLRIFIGKENWNREKMLNYFKSKDFC